MVVGRQSFLVGKLYVQGLLLLVQGTVVHHGSPTCFYPDTTEISLTVVFGPVFFLPSWPNKLSTKKNPSDTVCLKQRAGSPTTNFSCVGFGVSPFFLVGLYHHPKRINTFCQWWLTFREPNHTNQCCRGTLVLQHMFFFSLDSSFLTKLY